MVRLHRSWFVSFCLIALAALVLAPAQVLAAKPTFIPQQWDNTFTDPDFCGAGITVAGHDVGHGLLQVRYGSRGMPFAGSWHGQGTQTLTGPNGAVITITYSHRQRDVSIVDNGDGTYTESYRDTGSPFTAIFPTNLAGRGIGHDPFETLADFDTHVSSSGLVILPGYDQNNGTGICAAGLPVPLSLRGPIGDLSRVPRPPRLDRRSWGG